MDSIVASTAAEESGNTLVNQITARGGRKHGAQQHDDITIVLAELAPEG